MLRAPPRDGPERSSARRAPLVWRVSYQYPMSLPIVGPRVCGQRRRRYLGRFRDPARAYAGSQWHRSFQARETLPWLRGTYAAAQVDVPVRWVRGLDDPVITPNLHRAYAAQMTDVGFEEVPGAGHWIVEQRPDLALDRTRAFLRL